jgi:hypothetical protein
MPFMAQAAQFDVAVVGLGMIAELIDDTARPGKGVGTAWHCAD